VAQTFGKNRVKNQSTHAWVVASSTNDNNSLSKVIMKLRLVITHRPAQPSHWARKDTYQ